MVPRPPPDTVIGSRSALAIVRAPPLFLSKFTPMNQCEIVIQEARLWKIPYRYESIHIVNRFISNTGSFTGGPLESRVTYESRPLAHDSQLTSYELMSDTAIGGLSYSATAIENLLSSPRGAWGFLRWALCGVANSQNYVIKRHEKVTQWWRRSEDIHVSSHNLCINLHDCRCYSNTTVYYGIHERSE